MNNERTFYNKYNGKDEGAKFLFNISSQLDYHNNIIKIFY